jgi:hypothetical protein
MFTIALNQFRNTHSALTSHSIRSFFRQRHLPLSAVLACAVNPVGRLIPNVAGTVSP